LATIRIAFKIFFLKKNIKNIKKMTIVSFLMHPLTWWCAIVIWHGIELIKRLIKYDPAIDRSPMPFAFGFAVNAAAAFMAVAYQFCTNGLDKPF
jgi:hypothetical protein